MASRVYWSGAWPSPGNHWKASRSGEPAWHRRDRKQRTEDRTLWRVSQSMARLREHHSSGHDYDDFGASCQWCRKSIPPYRHLCDECLTWEPKMAVHRAPTTPTSQRGLDSQVDLLKRAAAQLGDTGSQALLKEQMGERINHLLEVKYEGMALEDRLPAVRKALELKREKTAFLKFRRQELLDEVQQVEAELSEMQRKTQDLGKKRWVTFCAVAGWMVRMTQVRSTMLDRPETGRVRREAGLHQPCLPQLHAYKRK